MADLPIWMALRSESNRFATPMWHGHEMLFGYAEAVLAGFLITRTTRSVQWMLFGAWILSRLAIFVQNAYLALAMGISFSLTMLVPAALPLLRAAKRRQNYIVPVMLLILIVMDVMWWTGTVWFGLKIQQRALLATVDLFALLMLIVGGRAVRAALGGYLERNGISRRDFPRRSYELPLTFLVGISCLFDVFGLEKEAGIFNILTAIIALVHILPWPLHYARKRNELWTLVVGYCWLIPGLLIKGGATFWPEFPVATSLHGITVGALGTLTLTMMARTAILQAHKSLQNFSDIGFAAFLIFIVALLRLIAPFAMTWRASLLWIAVSLWSAAFFLLLRRLYYAQIPVFKTKSTRKG